MYGVACPSWQQGDPPEKAGSCGLTRQADLWQGKTLTKSVSRLGKCFQDSKRTADTGLGVLGRQEKENNYNIIRKL